MDFSGNLALAVAEGDAKQASMFAADVTAPVLVSFRALNMTEGTVMLSFSEPMEPTSFDLTQVVLADFYTAPTVSYQLTGGVVITARSTTQLLSRAQLCPKPANCYMLFSAGLVHDVAGNGVVPSVLDVYSASAQMRSFRANSAAPHWWILGCTGRKPTEKWCATLRETGWCPAGWMCTARAHR